MRPRLRTDSSLRHPGRSFLGLRAPRSGSRATGLETGPRLDTSAGMHVRAIVHGTVQGVGFRYWTWKQAERLGLVGSATNLSDGTVEIIAQGPRWAVRDLLAAVQGPEAPGAVFRVDTDFRQPDPELSGFATA